MSKCHLTENWSWVEFFGVDGCLIVGAFPKFRIFTQHLSSASRKLQRSRPLKLKVKVLSSLKSFLCTVFLFIFHYRRRSESAPNFKYVGPPLSWLERILMAFEKKALARVKSPFMEYTSWFMQIPSEISSMHVHCTVFCTMSQSPVYYRKRRALLGKLTLKQTITDKSRSTLITHWLFKFESLFTATSEAQTPSLFERPTFKRTSLKELLESSKSRVVFTLTRDLFYKGQGDFQLV